jgi:hypothetical protein
MPSGSSYRLRLVRFRAVLLYLHHPRIIAISQPRSTALVSSRGLGPEHQWETIPIIIYTTSQPHAAHTPSRHRYHSTMCLITTPKKEPRYDVRRDTYDAPRPVSNYHGGRSSATYARPPNDRYRRSVSRTRIIETEPTRRSGRSVDYVRTQPRASGRSVDYVRTSRTYVR